MFILLPEVNPRPAARESHGAALPVLPMLDRDPRLRRSGEGCISAAGSGQYAVPPIWSASPGRGNQADTCPLPPPGVDGVRFPSWMTSPTFVFVVNEVVTAIFYIFLLPPRARRAAPTDICHRNLLYFALLACVCACSSFVPVTNEALWPGMPSKPPPPIPLPSRPDPRRPDVTHLATLTGMNGVLVYASLPTLLYPPLPMRDCWPKRGACRTRE